MMRPSAGTELFLIDAAVLVGYDNIACRYDGLMVIFIAKVYAVIYFRHEMIYRR